MFVLVDNEILMPSNLLHALRRKLCFIHVMDGCNHVMW